MRTYFNQNQGADGELQFLESLLQFVRGAKRSGRPDVAAAATAIATAKTPKIIRGTGMTRVFTNQIG
jgi:hypothetical protein